jgi:hypothetical protein
MKRSIASALLLLTFAFSPTVAAAAEAWGYFSCGLDSQTASLHVHSKLAIYEYDSPPPPADNSSQAAGDNWLADEKAFSEDLENLAAQFAELVEETFSAPCISAGVGLVLDHVSGPFKTPEMAQEAIEWEANTFGIISEATGKGTLRMEEIDFPTNQ